MEVQAVTCELRIGQDWFLALLSGWGGVYKSTSRLHGPRNFSVLELKKTSGALQNFYSDLSSISKHEEDTHET
jgi:hypothetical protein